MPNRSDNLLRWPIFPLLALLHSRPSSWRAGHGYILALSASADNVKWLVVWLNMAVPLTLITARWARCSPSAPTWAISHHPPNTTFPSQPLRP